MEPLKVTPDPQREGRFLLVDGYHRWKAAGELGIEELPCEVWHICPEEAKIRGLQLNYLRGQPVPDRLAHLIHDLNRELALSDLASMLPWSEAQLQDGLELLKLPADLGEQLEKKVAAHQAQAPIPVTVIMLPREHAAFEQALAREGEELGKGARRGELWAHVCRRYLGLPAPTLPPGQRGKLYRARVRTKVGGRKLRVSTRSTSWCCDRWVRDSSSGLILINGQSAELDPAAIHHTD